PANTPAEIAAILQQPEPERTSEQKAKLQAHYRAIAPQLAPIREELAKVQQARNQLFNQVPTTLVSMTQPPREMRVLPRGNWLDDSGEIVEPGVPEFLPGLNTEQRATRLDLARWMTSD